MNPILSKLESTPDNGASEQHNFGYFVTKGKTAKVLGDHQEDIVSWQQMDSKALFPKGADKSLTPTEIGFRLWTSYQLLDEQGKPELDIRGAVTKESLFGESGTTATTTVYDGKGNLITATLGDSVAFAAVYNKEGNPYVVISLNSMIHTLTVEKERHRLIRENSTVPVKKGKDYVVTVKEDSIKLSRAIGNVAFKPGICSESTINITSIDKIIEQNKLDPNNIGAIHIISTSNGFTDGSKKSKLDHASYLLQCLKELDKPGALAPYILAKELEKKARDAGSIDDIAIAIENIFGSSTPSMIGVNDGNLGTAAASYVANNLNKVFLEQCALNYEDYARQKLSAHQQEEKYNRDNKRNSLRPNSLSAVMIKKGLGSIKDIEKFITETKDQPNDVLIISSDAGKPFAAYIPKDDKLSSLKKDNSLKNEEIPKVVEIEIKDVGTIEHLINSQSTPDSTQPETSFSHDVVEQVLDCLEPPKEPLSADIVNQLKQLTSEYQSSLPNSNSSVKNKVQSIVVDLLSILDNKEMSDIQKIRNFYLLLNNDANSVTNLDIIKKDKTVSAASFIQGITLILTIIGTGIIPGLIICLATGKSPFNFFKSNAKQVEQFEAGVEEHQTFSPI